jgi:hypothetical protein
MPLDMEFTSRASKVGDKIRLDFICRYRTQQNTFSQYPVLVAWISADPQLKEWFNWHLPFRNLPFLMKTWQRRPRVIPEFLSITNTVEIPSDSDLVLRHGFMTFEIEGGAIVGSIPVNYLSPK